jgi:hypothetical protein
MGESTQDQIDLYYWAVVPPFIVALALLPKKTWQRGNHRMAQGGGQLSLT